MDEQAQEKAQKKKVIYRIGTIAMIVLPILAFILDLVGLIPLAKDVVGPLFWIIANIYMYFRKIPILSGKRFAAQAISLVTAVIPVIQELPIELTAGIIAIIIITRTEDKTGVSLPIGGKGVSISRKPLNSGGVRQPPPRIPEM